MDPNEALRIIRATIAQLRIEDRPALAPMASFIQHARDLAETVEGLDEWLTKGGFPPNDWVETPVAFPTRERIAETLAKVGHWGAPADEDALELADAVLALFTRDE